MNFNEGYENLIDNIYECIYKIETYYEITNNFYNKLDIYTIQSNLVNLCLNDFTDNLKLMEDILRYDFIYNE
jgi:hypothetical protein